MKLIRPAAIDDANLTSNVVNAHADWNSGTAYVVGNEVTYDHRSYISIQNGTNKNPATEAAFWTDIGPSNVWAMFDSQTSTASIRAADITVSVDVMGAADSVALLYVDGSAVNVTMRDGDATYTNLILRSEALDHAAWTATALTVTPDSADAAELLTPTGTGTHSIHQDVAVSSGADATFSISLGGAGYTKALVRIANAGETAAFQATVDLAAGTLSGNAYGAGTLAGATIAADGDLWRVALAGSIAAVSTYRCIVYLLDAAESVSFTGNGNGIVATAAQLETGLAASQYIVTAGSPASVTGQAVYDVDFSLTDNSGITDWFAYFFEPITRKTEFFVTDLPNYYNPTVVVTVTAAGDVEIGHCVIGFSREIGETQYGAQTGFYDYSKIEVDGLGVPLSITPRAQVRSNRFTVWVEANRHAFVDRLLASYHATPVVVIGADAYESTYGFGLLSLGGGTIAYPSHSIFDIELKGF